MNRIIDKRATGKTSRLILLAKESGATIACSNPSAMEHKSKAYGITGVNFISYGDLLLRGKKYNDVLIDELELFVKYAIGNTGKLVGYSLSEED